MRFTCRLSLLAGLLWIASVGFGSPVVLAQAVNVPPLLAKLHAVGTKGAGHRDAIAAMQTLATADPSQLPEVLAGLDGDCGPLAANWIRSAVEAIAGKATKNGTALPQSALEKFLADSKHSPRSRRLAFELITSVDKAAEQRLIPSFINDPSLELRRDAVALVLKDAESAASSGEKAQAIKLYQQALAPARDFDQIKLAFDKLKELGETPDVARQMGFILTWQLVGPFDNAGGKGFDFAYAPEMGVDLKAVYDAKDTKAKWFSHTTEDSFGLVDLTKALDKHKGAITYAYTEFIASGDQDVELRLGSVNGNKVWLNGKLLTSNPIYHAGRDVDQYVGKGRLRKGNNEILVKIVQNEQTEPWAQDWQFQLRVCDQIGTAVLSLDRDGKKTAQIIKDVK